MSFKDYLNETKDRGSNKIEAITTLVDALKLALGKYDISTRKSVWGHLNSDDGQELMQKIIRNPKTYLSNSEFRKLVQKS